MITISAQIRFVTRLLASKYNASEDTYVFNRDKNGYVYIPGYQMLGFLNEARIALNCRAVKKSDVTARMSLGIYLYPEPMYRGIAGMPTVTRPCRTRSGTVNITSQAINPEFDLPLEIKLLDSALVKFIYEALKYGEIKGIGHWRTGGNGRFKLVRFEDKEITDERPTKG
jgi:hypothetical protein